MTIAVVQISTPGQFNGSLTATTTFGSNPTAGNAVIFAMWHDDYSASNGTYTVSDGTNYSQDIVSTHSSNFITAMCGSRINIAGAGSPLTITAVCSAGSAANSKGVIIGVEVSGLFGFDKSSPNSTGSATSLSTGNTGTLATTNEFVIASFCAAGTLAGVTLPVTGGPGIYTDLVNDLTGVQGSQGDSAYQIIVGSTLAVSATIATANTAVQMCGVIATYSATAGAVLPLMGQICL